MKKKITTITYLLRITFILFGLLNVFFPIKTFALEQELYFERKPCLFFCNKLDDGSVNLFFNKNNGEYSHYYKTFSSKEEYYDFCSNNGDFCQKNVVVFDNITNKVYSTYEYDTVPLTKAISNFKNVSNLFDKLKFAYQPVTETGLAEVTYRSISANYKAIPINDSVFSVSKKILYNEIIKEDLLTLGKAFIVSNSNTEKMGIEEGFIKWGSNNKDYNLSFGTSILFSDNSYDWVSKNSKNYGFVNAYENCQTDTNPDIKNKLFRWIGLRLVQDYELYNTIHGNTCIQDYLQIKQDNITNISSKIDNDNFSQGLNFLDNLYSDNYAYYKTTYNIFDIYKAIEEKYSMSDLIKILFKNKNLEQYIVKSQGTTVTQNILDNSPYRANDKDKLNDLIFSTSDIYRFTNAKDVNDFRIYNNGDTIYIIKNSSIQYLDENKELSAIINDKIDFINKDKVIDITKVSDDSFVLIKETNSGTYNIPSKIYLYNDLWSQYQFEIPNFLGNVKYILFLKKDGTNYRNFMSKDDFLKIASPIQYNKTVFDNIVKIDKTLYYGFYVNNDKDISNANTLLGMKIGNDKNYLIKDVNNHLFFIQKVLGDNTDNSIVYNLYNNDITSTGTTQSGGNIDFLELQKKLNDNRGSISSFLISLVGQGFIIKNSSKEQVLFLCKENKCAVLSYPVINILEVVNITKNINNMSENEINTIYSSVAEQLKPKEISIPIINQIISFLTFSNIVKLIILLGSLLLLFFLLNTTPTKIAQKLKGLFIYLKDKLNKTNNVIQNKETDIIQTTDNTSNSEIIDIINNLNLESIDIQGLSELEIIDKHINTIDDQIEVATNEKNFTLSAINESFNKQGEIIHRKLQEEAERLRLMLELDKKNNEEKILNMFSSKINILENEKLKLMQKKQLLIGNKNII